jgi:hypothetical protein
MKTVEVIVCNWCGSRVESRDEAVGHCQSESGTDFWYACEICGRDYKYLPKAVNCERYCASVQPAAEAK